MEKLEAAKITRVEIRTTTIMGEFEKVFFEDLVLTKTTGSFLHRWLDPTKKPIHWAIQSNSNERFVAYYLFLEALLKEMHTAKLHENREFSTFKITLFEKKKIVFQRRFNGTFELNNFTYSRNTLLGMIPKFEFLPMYLLEKFEYEAEAEDFGKEVITDEQLELKPSDIKIE